MVKTSIILALGASLACMEGVASTAHALAGLGYGGGSHGTIGGSTHGGQPGGAGSSAASSPGNGGHAGSANAASASYGGTRANYGLGAGANYGVSPASDATQGQAARYGSGTVVTNAGRGAAVGGDAQAGHVAGSTAPAHGLAAGVTYGQPPAFRGGLFSAMSR